MTRILHVDDDANIRSMVATYFAHFAPDWDLENVATGQACLDRMAKGGIDILLLDLVLPDIHGLHVLGELIRRDDPTPVVIVSGQGQNENAVRALRAGALDCVDKTSPQFLQIVDVAKRVLARHQARRVQLTAAPAQQPHRLLLVEVSAATRGAIEEYFRSHAPQFELTAAASPAEFEDFLTGYTPAEAVLIGPTPGDASPLDTLRRLRSHRADLPAVLITARDDGATAVAAFKLGAQDYILQKRDYLADVVFSLNNIVRQAATERRNAELTREFEALNHSLEAQVQARTGELQALSLRLLRVQEEERRVIARELHDNLGQLLTGLKFQLEAAHRAASPALQATLTESLGLSDEMLRYLREMTQLLRPRVLDDLGLAPALEWHASLFHRQTGIAVVLDVSLPPGRLPGELETTVFRLVQESLTNVARHAGTTDATVTLTHGDGRLMVEVTDRGRGFDLDAVQAARDSLGLTGLRERVTLVGGRLEIYSRVGQGTRISADLPLPIPLTPNPPLPP